MNPLEFFWLFFKSSLLSTGGLGNLPFLHQDMIRLGWASESDFVTAIAVGQISPGPTGLWSISLAYLTYGWVGSLLALAAICLPPLLALLVEAFYNRIGSSPRVQDFTRGMGLGVVGLTLVVSLNLASSINSDWGSLLIGLAALLLLLTKRIPVIIVLGAAALAGIIFY